MLIRIITFPFLTLWLSIPAFTQDSTFLVKLESTIQERIDAGEIPSMAFAIAKDGKIVYQNAWGWADIENQIPATPHTSYQIASTSKSMTATGIMILDHQGNIDIQDEAEKYMGPLTFDNPHNFPQKVTIQHLLNHTSGLGTYFDIYYRASLKGKGKSIGSDVILHRTFSTCTFLAFNCFFIYGGRPELLRLPIVLQLLFNAAVVLVSALWLVRNWNYSEEKYKKDSLAHSFRCQLEKLPIDLSSLLNQRSLNELTSDELFILASVIPKLREKERWQIYKAIFQDGLVNNTFTSADSFEMLKQIRSNLDLKEEEHYSVLSQIISENPDLMLTNQFNQKSSVTAKISHKNNHISSQADQPTLIRRKSH